MTVPDRLALTAWILLLPAGMAVAQEPSLPSPSEPPAGKAAHHQTPAADPVSLRGMPALERMLPGAELHVDRTPFLRRTEISLFRWKEGRLTVGWVQQTRRASALSVMRGQTFGSAPAPMFLGSAQPRAYRSLGVGITWRFGGDEPPPQSSTRSVSFARPGTGSR